MAIVTPGRYSGTSFAAIDGKGRIAVPASLRNNVPANDDGERVLWVGHHEVLPCLVAFGSDQFDRLNDEIARAGQAAENRNLDFDDDAEFKKRFNFTDPYVLDASGRFLPGFTCRELVGETGATAFVGAGRRFEIWWIPTLLAFEGADPKLQHFARQYQDKARGRK